MGMFQTTGSNERFGVLEGSRQRSVAATGSSQTDAANVGRNVNLVTGADGTKGVILSPAKIVGQSYLVYSSAATNALPVYPPSGGTINSGTANASLSVTARKPVYFIATSKIDFIAIVGA
jgi:hypothetical protein